MMNGFRTIFARGNTFDISFLSCEAVSALLSRSVLSIDKAYLSAVPARLYANHPVGFQCLAQLFATIRGRS